MPPSRYRAAAVDFLGSFPSEVPRTGLPEVAFAGRSNVGKSSAINALLGRRGAARVSRTPGRTQAVNLFRIDGRVCFADLPGYGFARVPEAVRARWKGLVEGYLGADRDLRLVVVLVDARLPAQALDIELLAGLREASVPWRVVATKVDRVGASRRRVARSLLARGLGLADDELLWFSSTTGEGVDDLWGAVRAACG